MTETIGEKIKNLRLIRGYTQEELAERLYMRKSTISAYENNAIEGIRRYDVGVDANNIFPVSVKQIIDFLRASLTYKRRECYIIHEIIADNRK